MTTKSPRSISLVIVILFGIGSISSQEAPPSLSIGLREYQAGQFGDALGAFQDASAEASGTEFEGFSDFWIARSLMALNRYDESSDAFDLFLTEYDSHPYGEEATYQRARLFFLTGEFEAAVHRFNEFQLSYPGSDFSANALYWTGESLFALGLLSESRRFFEEVTERHPTSYRVEAARYRRDVIDLAVREDELLTLLRWSHEEYLSALDEFGQKELSYQDALQTYRDRLRDLAAQDFLDEIQTLNAQIADLEEGLSERDAQIDDLLAQLRQAQINTSSGSLGQQASSSVVVSETLSDGEPQTSLNSVQGELLSIKAAALQLQQRLLQQGGAR